ncbi:hypothetical protein BCR44DRAFT_1502287 [Catenaria anguillulae PL171]|uniref:Uncharacterized protein n=1 Tax=Catenaria anguillulae PL171 TaxID=765915 RepID=A0A1Y2HED4_9FUNG|nr:hypothetical protein BCR44DRAFT_1502287 [Catenaria anguillulae PL171]
MRQYTLQEFSTAKTLMGQPFTASSDILPNGTFISMILVGRTPEAPTGFTLWAMNHFKPTSSISYTEELFFQILSYEPAPRDRYHVERVPGPFGTDSRVFHPKLTKGYDWSTTTTLHGVTLNRKLYEVLLEEEVYAEQRQLRGAKHKLKSKLATGDISHDEYVTELAGPSRPTIKNVTLTVDDKQWTSLESRFLKLGDRITAKRKNVHLVFSPKDQPAGNVQTSAFYQAKFLTTWGGTLLDRESALKLIGPGNLVRVATKEVGAVYFAIMGIDRSKPLLAQSAFGVLLDYYLTMDDQLERVGEYWQFPLSSIIEVPESWAENASITKSLLQLKQAKGLAVTGMTAVDDDE